MKIRRPVRGVSLDLLPMPQRPTRPYRGDFVAWNGGGMFIGSGAGVVAPHAHYAIQLVLGAPSGLRVQFGRNGEWQPCAAALLPSRATHAIDVFDCEWTAVVFIEPETSDGRALTSRLQGAMEALDPDAVAVMARRLERAWRTERDGDAVGAICRQWLRELSQAASAEPSDPRILAAVATIRERPDEAVTLAQLAAAAHLSPGRFRHLFVEQTGMPLRTYLLWRRLLHVWTLLMQGESLSRAAHAAGFADSAHLARTARTMFGLPPSALQANGPLAERLRDARVH
jgi:AraC family transcriptional regulator